MVIILQETSSKMSTCNTDNSNCRVTLVDPVFRRCAVLHSGDHSVGVHRQNLQPEEEEEAVWATAVKGEVGEGCGGT